MPFARRGRELEGGEPAAQDGVGEVGVGGDGGVDGVEGGGDVEGRAGEEGLVGAWEGVEVLSAEVGCVVVG